MELIKTSSFSFDLTLTLIGSLDAVKKSKQVFQFARS